MCVYVFERCNIIMIQKQGASTGCKCVSWTRPKEKRENTQHYGRYLSVAMTETPRLKIRPSRMGTPAESMLIQLNCSGRVMLQMCHRDFGIYGKKVRDNKAAESYVSWGSSVLHCATGYSIERVWGVQASPVRNRVSSIFHRNFPLPSSLTNSQHRPLIISGGLHAGTDMYVWMDKDTWDSLACCVFCGTAT